MTSTVSHRGEILGVEGESPRADDDWDLYSGNSSDRRRLPNQQADRTLVSFLPSPHCISGRQDFLTDWSPSRGLPFDNFVLPHRAELRIITGILLSFFPFISAFNSEALSSTSTESRVK